jgi:ferrous iron transport protein B
MTDTKPKDSPPVQRGPRAPHEGRRVLHFALAGNPNCGKTTLFNQLTGSSQYVGNWPGVTVEKKEGRVRQAKIPVSILDLPGIYSLSPYSPEEIVTRNCLIDEHLELIINIVDATNIERNLYLTTQLAELGCPMIIALNMIDLLEKRGDQIDYRLLEKELGIPVVPISASRGIGLQKLIERGVDFAEAHPRIAVKNTYSDDVDLVLRGIEDVLRGSSEDERVNTRWTAVKLFEGDNITVKKLRLNELDARRIVRLVEMIPTTPNVDREMIIADQRYRYICALCARAVHKGHAQGYVTLSDKIDRIATSRIWAIPLFLLMMLFIFFITFGPFGSLLQKGAEWLIKDWFSGVMGEALTAANASPWAVSLVLNGVIEGVGSVVSFLPQIMLLFMLLSILEDSGYMARAAFIMDQLLRKIGLSGRAFVPMLMGFGCTVPAVLGTRTLENEKDKRLTILITPFMSCSAKMPVYSLFIAVFFVKNSPLVIFSIYLLGIFVAILTALLFKNTILTGEPAPFVMELPPYRLPTPKSLFLHVWERLKDFLTKAGTVLLGATIVIWFLQSFNLQLQMVEDSAESILASVGTAIAPIFTLCGFGNWKASVSLVTGLAAKESVVSTMAVLYGGGDLTAMLGQVFTPLSAYAFMVFVLLYTPCVAALSAIHREMGSVKWTLVTVGYQLLVAWFASAMVFQMGTLIGNMF